MPTFDTRIEQVVFSGDNHFYILKLSAKDNPFDMIHAKGNLPGFRPKVGALFSFEGEWTTHPKFGRQVDIQRGPLYKKGGVDIDSVIGALSQENLPPIVYDLLRTVPESDLLDLLSDVDKLTALLGADWAKVVRKAWGESYDYLKVLQKLQDLGVPPAKVGMVRAFYGEEAPAKILANPWGLTRISGFSLPICDSIAINLGFTPKNQSDRIQASIYCHLKACRQRGHLFLSASELLSGVEKDIEDLTLTLFADAIKAMVASQEVVVDSTSRPGTKAIYEKRVYETEVKSAQMLKERLAAPTTKSYLHSLEAYTKSSGDLDTLVKAALEKYLPTQKWTFSANQKQGILNALTYPVSILTGLPGTGKTTSLKAVVQLLEDLAIPFALVAPTGIAAKRLSSVTGAPAATIHRAFGGAVVAKEKTAEYAGIVQNQEDPDEDEDTPPESMWAYSPDNPHPADVIIVDESSMVDQTLLHRILYSTKPDCRIVFAGDAAQLPSVGPGDVLRAMIASNQIPSVNLTEIFRQSLDNGIVLAAHSLHAGKTPQGSPDFQILEVDGDENVAREVVNLARHLNSLGVNHQVLSPRHQGSIGVTTLNQLLREEINPAGVENRVGDSVIRQGDKVMVIKNDYQLKVFNGEVGVVTRIDKHNLDVTITGDDRTVTFLTRNASRKIRLAYCCTVHKSQGLEYDAIVMPMTMSLHHQLQRNLVYTAITRAKKKVFLVGTRSALHRAAINGQIDVRNTLLKERLNG